MMDVNSKYSISIKKLIASVPRWECHAHTVFGDGTATVEEMTDRAVKIGLERIIFTEHTELSLHREDENWFSAYMDDIQNARSRFEDRIEIVAGLETPATDLGTGLGLDDNMRLSVDFIIGSAHRYPGLGNKRVRDLAKEDFIEYEYRTLMALAANPHIDAIGHIGGTCRKYCCEMPEHLISEVIRTASHNGISVEINCRHHFPLRKFVDLCVRENVHVTLGSDAHSIDDVGTAFECLKRIYN